VAAREIAIGWDAAASTEAGAGEVATEAGTTEDAGAPGVVPDGGAPAATPVLVRGVTHAETVPLRLLAARGLSAPPSPPARPKPGAALPGGIQPGPIQQSCGAAACSGAVCGARPAATHFIAADLGLGVAPDAPVSERPQAQLVLATLRARAKGCMQAELTRDPSAVKGTVLVKYEIVAPGGAAPPVVTLGDPSKLPATVTACFEQFLRTRVGYDTRPAKVTFALRFVVAPP